MQVNPDKIVEFHEYCAKCEHFEKAESEDPCFECLDEPVNEFSHRPIHFKAKKYRAKGSRII